MAENFKLRTSTKVIYALFHFFTPFLMYAVLTADDGLKGPLPLVFFCVALALFLLIRGVLKYRHFVTADEENLYICINKGKDVEILNKIAKSSIKEFKCSFRKLYAIVGKQKIKILDISPSIIPLILTFPIFSIPFIYRTKFLATILLYRFNSLIGKATEEDFIDAQQIAKQKMAMNIITWLFLSVIIFLGSFGFIFSILQISTAFSGLF